MLKINISHKLACIQENTLGFWYIDAIYGIFLRIKLEIDEICLILQRYRQSPEIII